MVSVIIPTYNRAKILPRAINSVLAQSFQDFEIIIVDDCSSDDTDRVVQALNEKRVKYIKHSKNMGGAGARNTGIQASKGELLAFLDSDDEWAPEKLMKQVEAFNQISKDHGLVYTGLRIMDSNGDFVTDQCLEKQGNTLNNLLIENFVSSTSSIMVKKEFINRVEGFDLNMKSCQDWDLYLRLSQICLFYCVPEFLVKIHVDTKVNRISNNKKSVISGHLKIQEKYSLLYEQLPKDLQLQHLNYMSYIYLDAGSLSLSLKMVLKSFICTLNPFYFYKMIQRTGLFVKRRMLNKSYIYGGN